MEPIELTPEDLQALEATRQGVLKMREENPSLFETVKTEVVEGAKEAPFQAVRGMQEAANEVSDASFSVAKWLNDNIMDLGHIRIGKNATGGTPFDDKEGFGFEGFISWNPGMPMENALKFSERTLVGSEPKTYVGAAVNDVAQFIGPFALVGRLWRTTSAVGAIGEGMVRGAIVDATAFDPHEERLANIMEEHEFLNGPITEYLAASPDDSEAEGRFKNALEGLLLGGVTEGLFHAVRAIRFKRQGKLKEAQEALEEVEKAQAAKPEEAPTEAPKAEEKPAEESAATAPKQEEQLNLDLGDEFQDTFTGQRGENGKLEAEDMAADIPSKNGKEPFKDTKPFVKVTEEELQSLENMETAELGFGQGRNLSGIDMNRIEGDESLNAMVSSIARQYADRQRQAIGGNADGVRSWERVRANADKFADLIGEDPRILFQRMRALHKETFMADAEMLAYRDVLATVARQREEAAEAIVNPHYDFSKGKFKSLAEARLQYARAYEIMANAQLMYKGLQTNLARALNSMKQMAEVKEGMLDGVSPEEMWKGGPRVIEKLARQTLANKGNLKAQLKETRGGIARKFFDSVTEFHINALLSGPKTHVVNMMSGVFNTAYMPMEKMIAGAWKGDRSAIREGADIYAGLVTNLYDAFRLASKAFKAGDPILDPTHGGTEYRAAISSRNYGITDPTMQMIVDGIGNIVRIPSRFLAAEDEFLKQLNYRAHVRAQALREGRQDGKVGKDLAEYVARRLDEATDADGSAFTRKGREANKEALNYAREVTYTQDLGGQVTHFGNQTWGEWLQGGMVNHPYMRLMVPFVRTPTNLFRFVHHRTPGLNLLRKQYYMDFMGKNGADAAAKARAQMTTGAALWIGASAAVYSGIVTGGGPADPDIRKALMETGWRPYSIRIERDDGTVAYASYNRLDPFGMFLGLAADFAEVAGAFPERELDDTALAMVTALAKNLNNKSYLKGIMDGLAALAEPERRGAYFLNSFASGFMPNLASQLNNDPHLREVRSVIDGMRRKVPGYSTDLDPVRNILGEKQYHPPGLGPDFISPIVTGYNKNDTQPITDEWKYTPKEDVYDELARQMFILNKGLRQPPREVQGVDLTQYVSPDSGYTAHDRLQELTGTITDPQGRTLKDALSELFKSEEYKTVLADGDFRDDGGRMKAISNVISAYREAALGKLRQEIPQLHWDMVEAQRQKALKQVQPQHVPDALRNPLTRQ